MHSLSSRVFLVTGAAGNLGSAVVAALHAAGARVALVERNAAKGAAVLATLPAVTNSAGPEVSVAHHRVFSGVDLGNESAVNQLIADVVAHFGRLDGVAHTVGTWRGGQPVHETPLEDWAFLHDTNVRTTLLLARATAPRFIAQRRGGFVTVGARSGLQGDAGSAAYSATKAALLRLNESLAAELKTSGINVNCVLPSLIDTPQNRAAMPAADHSKWVEPAAIADVIAFLLSDAARAIHGAAIPVYGLS